MGDAVNLIHEFRDIIYCGKSSDDFDELQIMRRQTVAMHEDPKAVLRGMLTQVGESDNFISHGERDERD